MTTYQPLNQPALAMNIQDKTPLEAYRQPSCGAWNVHHTISANGVPQNYNRAFVTIPMAQIRQQQMQKNPQTNYQIPAQRTLSAYSYFQTSHQHTHQLPTQSKPCTLYSSVPTIPPDSVYLHGHPAHNTSGNPFNSNAASAAPAQNAASYLPTNMMVHNSTHMSTANIPTPLTAAGSNSSAALVKQHQFSTAKSEQPIDNDSIADDDSDFWEQISVSLSEIHGSDSEGGKHSPARRSSSLDSDFSEIPSASSAHSQKSSLVIKTNTENKVAEVKNERPLDKNGLPAGGKYYKTTLPGSGLSNSLFRAGEKGENIYSAPPTSFIKMLGTRPVVGYTHSESAVDNKASGVVSVGDVLIKVQNHHVENPKSAMYFIDEACNKNKGYTDMIELYMWRPPSSIRVTHGGTQCVVEYHNKSVDVPKTSRDWKGKYVVIGGIAADPWVVKMYHDKKKYAKALSDTNEKKTKVSVKVKSFSLIGAELITPEIKTVHYMKQSCRRPWYYFVVLTMDGKAIKIGHAHRMGIEPVLGEVKKAIEYTKKYKGF